VTRPRRTHRDRTSTALPPPGYADLARRPLHCLVFLLPLLVLYEIGSLLYLTDPDTGLVETISAYSIIGRASEAFGVAGVAIPAALLVAVLLTWHIVARDPWKVRPGVLAGMTVESLAWTLPLLVIAVLVGPTAAMQTGGAAGIGGGAVAASDPAVWPWQARLTLAVGAGLYEEMLFRLLLIPVAVVILRDLARLQLSSARVGAVGLSALLFALYHDLSGPGATIDPARLLLFLLAGLFFGGLFLWRGFGVVVGVHAVYDIVALLIITKSGG
jgi:membrane protease YdiL (CAAX protease family)